LYGGGDKRNLKGLETHTPCKASDKIGKSGGVFATVACTDTGGKERGRAARLASVQGNAAGGSTWFRKEQEILCTGTDEGNQPRTEKLGVESGFAAGGRSKRSRRKNHLRRKGKNFEKD